jgi:hypothetical protein
MIGYNSDPIDLSPVISGASAREDQQLSAHAQIVSQFLRT